MASSEHIKALLRSHLERDDECFLSIALKVAAHEARSGHGRLAQEGEARRILNSFLQMIDQDDSNSVIVCATNHVEILDHALFRRFDDVVRYKLPGPDEVVTLFRNRLKPYLAQNFPWKKLPEKAQGLSSAEITLAAEDAIKDLLIHEHRIITLPMLESAVNDRRSMTHHAYKSLLTSQYSHVFSILESRI